MRSEARVEGDQVIPAEYCQSGDCGWSRPERSSPVALR